MMPAHNVRHLWPREMHTRDDAVADGGVVGDLAKLFWIEAVGLAEEALIDSNLAYVVEIGGRTNACHVGGSQAQGFCHRCGIAGDAQRMPLQMNVLDVDCGGEGLECAVVESVG